MAITLYEFPGSPRCYVVQGILKYLDVEIKTLNAYEHPEYKELFPLGKLPAIVGEKGIKVYETLACVDYVISISKSDKAATFKGKTAMEQVRTVQWTSIFTTSLLESMGDYILPLVGKGSYNKVKSDAAFKNIEKIAELVDSRLKEFTYLSAEFITPADVFAAQSFATLFKFVLDQKWAAAHPETIRWYKTVIEHPLVKCVVPGFFVTDKRAVYTPPKKEKKAAEPKAEKPKAAEAAAPAPAAEEIKKPKHPLELLGKPKMALDEWKRVYSNEETRETALPWFWEHYDPSEWSLWKVAYKYNDELTLTFMSNNLVGGFMNRLSASTKYMFGCMVVYGENNNNGIIGAFLVRGQEHEPAFDVAPDWESYEFEKLDGSKPEVKDFVDNMFAWDKPVVINGESKEIADGKVFK